MSSEDPPKFNNNVSTSMRKLVDQYTACDYFTETYSQLARPFCSASDDVDLLLEPASHKLDGFSFDEFKKDLCEKRSSESSKNPCSACNTIAITSDEDDASSLLDLDILNNRRWVHYEQKILSLKDLKQRVSTQHGMYVPYDACPSTQYALDVDPLEGIEEFHFTPGTDTIRSVSNSTLRNVPNSKRGRISDCKNSLPKQPRQPNSVKDETRNVGRSRAKASEKVRKTVADNLVSQPLSRSRKPVLRKETAPKNSRSLKNTCLKTLSSKKSFETEVNSSKSLKKAGLCTGKKSSEAEKNSGQSDSKPLRSTENVTKCRTPGCVPLTCKICDEVFDDTFSMCTHMLLHNKNQRKPRRVKPQGVKISKLICGMCEPKKEFVAMAELKEHTKVEHRNARLGIVCVQCQQSFETFGPLRQHILDCHPENCGTRCAGTKRKLTGVDCGTNFQEVKSLEQVEDVDSVSRPLRCELQCGSEMEVMHQNQVHLLDRRCSLPLPATIEEEELTVQSQQPDNNTYSKTKELPRHFAPNMEVVPSQILTGHTGTGNDLLKETQFSIFGPEPWFDPSKPMPQPTYQPFSPPSKRMPITPRTKFTLSLQKLVSMEIFESGILEGFFVECAHPNGTVTFSTRCPMSKKRSMLLRLLEMTELAEVPPSIKKRREKTDYSSASPDSTDLYPMNHLSANDLSMLRASNLRPKTRPFQHSTRYLNNTTESEIMGTLSGVPSYESAEECELRAPNLTSYKSSQIKMSTGYDAVKFLNALRSETSTDGVFETPGTLLHSRQLEECAPTKNLNHPQAVEKPGVRDTCSKSSGVKWDNLRDPNSTDSHEGAQKTAGRQNVAELLKALKTRPDTVLASISALRLLEDYKESFKLKSSWGEFGEKSDFVCQQCPQKPTFRTRRGLQNHVDTKHMGISLYSCSLCRLKFKRVATYEKHLFAKHFFLPENY